LREQGRPQAGPLSFKIPKTRHDGMALTEAAVAEIKCLHQACELTLDQIGARYGIAATAVSRLARIHGWPSRSELMGRSPRKLQPVAAQSRTRLVCRLYNTITMMLELMEAEMKSGTLKAPDFERIGRSVAAMLGGLSKATATEPDGDKKTPNTAEPAAAPDDAERLHREIVERFERIQRRRNAERGSG
jgi:hypothetical protein